MWYAIIEAHIEGMGGDDALTLLLSISHITNQKCKSNSQIADKYFQFSNFKLFKAKGKIT
jgi:hypothetical protein